MWSPLPQGNISMYNMVFFGILQLASAYLSSYMPYNWTCRPPQSVVTHFWLRSAMKAPMPSNHWSGVGHCSPSLPIGCAHAMSCFPSIWGITKAFLQPGRGFPFSYLQILLIEEWVTLNKPEVLLNPDIFLFLSLSLCIPAYKAANM